jgi:hypothetical protein
MKVIKFDSCMGCPYFIFSGTGIKIEGEPIERKNARCGYSQRDISLNLTFERAVALSKLMPDWCALPDEQVNGIPAN